MFNPGGGTGANLALNQDGSIGGEYTSISVESGDGYQTTIYTCSFEGQFEDIRQVNDYTWSMTLKSDRRRLFKSGPSAVFVLRKQIMRLPERAVWQSVRSCLLQKPLSAGRTWPL